MPTKFPEGPKATTPRRAKAECGCLIDSPGGIVLAQSSTLRRSVLRRSILRRTMIHPPTPDAERAETARAISVYIVAGAIAAGIFAADLLTPLGVAVWILYILPVGLTLLGRDETAPIIAGVGCTLLL